MVVDDGSADNTSEIARAAGALVVRHEQNQGKGVALTTGLKMVRDLCPKAVVVMDGDGQHIPAQIPIVAAPILAGTADIVVGSRYLEPEKSDVPIHRVLGHQVFNMMTNVISGEVTTDSQSGFRAFSTQAVNALSDTNLSSRGFGVESEMQMWAYDYQLRMMDVSIQILYPDPPKRSVVLHGVKVVRELTRLISQHRPLLYFGVSGGLLSCVGTLLGAWCISVYLTNQQITMWAALLAVLCVVLGWMMVLTGILLHSMRRLLLTWTSESHAESRQSRAVTRTPSDSRYASRARKHTSRMNRAASVEFQMP